MKKTQRSIKIKVEGQSYTQKDLEDIAKWEDEGGQPLKTATAEMVKLPVKKGQIFEVSEGDLIYENDELYYRVELNILSYR